MGNHSDIVGGSTAGRFIECIGSVPLVAKAKADHKERIFVQFKASDTDGIYTAYNSYAEVVETDASSVIIKTVDAQYEAENTSPYAAEGDMLHEVIAHCVTTGINPVDYAKQEQCPYKLDPDQVRTLQVAYHSFKSYVDALETSMKANNSVYPVSYIVVEQECEFPNIEGAFGTVDVFLRCGNVIVCWDWKFGAGVRVQNNDDAPNIQLLYYTLASFNSLRETLELDQPFDSYEFRSVICQPRVQGGECLESTVSADYFLDFYKTMRNAYKRYLAGDTTLKIGPHCRWCPAKPLHCPAHSDSARSVMADLADATALKKNPALALGDSNDEREGLSASEAYNLALQLEPWIVAVKTLALSELDAGRQIEGYELDMRLGNASWVDEGALPAIFRALGVPAKTYKTVKYITPTKTREFLKAKGRLADDKKTLLEQNIHRKLSGTKIVPVGTAKNPPLKGFPS